MVSVIHRELGDLKLKRQQKVQVEKKNKIVDSVFYWLNNGKLEGILICHVEMISFGDFHVDDFVSGLYISDWVTDKGITTVNR